jgi:uridine kinase
MKKIPLVIGIAGGSASGKTTVTLKILERLDVGKVVLLRQDYYYKDLSAFGDLTPDKINFDHPNALESPLLLQHISELKRWRPIRQPLYDYATYRRLLDTTAVEPRSVIIVEGILIFAERDLRELMDIKIFVDTDADERLLRRLRRDMMERGRSFDSVMKQYVETVKPMHEEFVEPSKRWADVIIPKGGENAVAIDMVVTRIRELLSQT